MKDKIAREIMGEVGYARRIEEVFARRMAVSSLYMVASKICDVLRDSDPSINDEDFLLACGFKSNDYVSIREALYEKDDPNE